MLEYDGTLTDITNAEPVFGTDGDPSFSIPEPGAAGFLLLGLAGLALRARSR